MNIALWVLQVALALVFAGAGGAKLVRSKAQLRKNPQMAWTDDFSPGAIRAIGAAEVLAAVGLVLPRVLDILPVLTPLAATGLVLLMAGAFLTHLRRGDPTPSKVVTTVLAVLAGVVAWGRFGPYSF